MRSISLFHAHALSLSLCRAKACLFFFMYIKEGTKISTRRSDVSGVLAGIFFLKKKKKKTPVLFRVFKKFANAKNPETRFLTQNAHSRIIIERERRRQRRRYKIRMGRTPVKLKEVIYGISSNKVEIMGSLGRDALSAISKKIGGGWFDVTVFGIAPTVGTVMYELDLFCCFLFSSFVVFCCFR